MNTDSTLHDQSGSLSAVATMIVVVLVVIGSTMRSGAVAAETSRPSEQATWDFARLVQHAEQSSMRDFQPSPALPERLRRLDYDEYRLIAYEHEAAVWKHEPIPFRLEFFHRGYLFGERVSVHLVDDGRVRPVTFRRNMFQYRGKMADLEVPADPGFAGLRILGKFESSRNFQEIASFLGASYFRALGSEQVYGTSARGLAIDVGLPQPEEFPAFREYWVERPAMTADELRFAALLESPSAAGAYRFVLRPGATTTIDVEAKVFFRRAVAKVGIAPLTSMWQWGDGLRGPADDPRPEVHDADGLLMHTGDDQWIYRALGRQSYPSLSRFDFAGLRGFGLVQRDRTAEHYADAEARYERRPSVWIEPHGNWGAGAVELLELPSDHEGIDDIAAWWTPREPLPPHRPLELRYRISFTSVEPGESPLGRAADFDVEPRPDGTIGLRVDFVGDRAKNVVAADAPVVPEVTCLRGTLGSVSCRRLSERSWRLRFDVRPSGAEPMELSAVLRQGNDPLTETWRYLCPTRK